MDFRLPMHSVLATATVAAAALGLGSRLAAALRSNVGGRCRQAIWETTLGFVVAGLAIALLGFAGRLCAEAITIGTAGCAVIGILRLRSLGKVATVDSSDERATAPLPRLQIVLLGCGFAAATASFVSALAPPTAGDALCYHLELPKEFLAAGRLVVPPDDDNAVYPLLTEMWFVWGLAVDGPVTAQLLHWVCGLLTAGTAAIAAWPIVGRAGAIAVANLVLVVPGINNQMTAPLNDVALAMLCTAAFAAWCRACDAPSRKAFAVVGLLLGGALGVKYTALVFVVAAAGAACRSLTVEPRRRRELGQGLAVAAGVALLTAAPWYVRAYVHRGDPVYPFLSAQTTTESPSAFPESKTPLGRGPTAVVLAPWSMTMEPDRFGGRGNQLGPLLLMFAPFAPALWRRKHGPTAACLVGGYALGCVLLRQNVRFLLPVVPSGLLLVAAGLGETASWPRRVRWVASGATLVAVVLCAAVPVARAVRHFRVAVGWETRESYLARVEPTTELAAKMNALLPPEARLLSQEGRRFYLPRETTRENIFRRRTGYSRELAPGTLDDALRRYGFTHVLLAETEGSKTTSYDGTLSTLVDRETSRESTPRAPVFTASGRDVDGNVRRYRVFELR